MVQKKKTASKTKPTHSKRNGSDSQDPKNLELQGLPPQEMIEKLKFCVFDLETTGGNHQSDKIIEIGLVRIEGLKIVETKGMLIRPEIKIPDFIQKLTSISQDDVKDAPVIEDVIDEILDMMEGHILVAHNTSFDIPFFNSVLRRLGKPELTNPALCTNLMTKYLIPNLMNSNLNYMSKIFNIKHNKAHRALDDAKATAELLLNYLTIFIDKKIKKINHLYYPRNRYELDRLHFKAGVDSANDIEKALDKLKVPSLVTIKGENGTILFSLPVTGTKSERDLVMSKVDLLNWETVTVKLEGPFLESLLQFAVHYSKLDISVRNEVLRFLWKTHMPNHKMPAKPSEDSPFDPSLEVMNPEFGHFIISNHLVPEQMIIYPLHALGHKQELVFRYPGHKKKLLQYINSRSSKGYQAKFKGTPIHPTLKSFIDQYLVNCKKSGKDLFIFTKSLALKRPEEFLRNLEAFTGDNPNNFKFPKDYL